MFEGTLKDSGFKEAAKPSALHPIAWPVLVARLEAARVLHSVATQPRIAVAGNFSCFTSADPEVVKENSAGVNLEALADGKCSGANVPDTANETHSGDRE